MAPSMQIDVKMEKKKKNKSKDLTEAEEVMDYPDDSSRKEKKKKKSKETDSALIQLIAKYLDKRNLQKSLTSLLSETQCKSSWKTQTMDLEDIYNQYSNQDSENLKKHNVEDRNVEQENNHLSIKDQNNNLKLLEQEFQTEDTSKVANSNAAPSFNRDLKISGALKPQVSGSDKSVSSCDNAQSELAKSKDKKYKAPGNDIDPDSEKTPNQTDSVKLEKYLQELVEVPKEVKNKKKKKNTEYKDLIDNDEHKTSTHKENRSSIKDNSNPPKTSSKQMDHEKLDNTSQESPEVLKEEDKKKRKKNSEEKDLIINDEKETSTNIENGNSIRDKSKPSKTLQKNKDCGNLDKSFQEALEVPNEEEKKQKKKKKIFEDKDLIDNNEQKTSIDRENKKAVKDNSKLSKVSNKVKVFLELDESLQESLEVPKQKRKKEQETEDEDSEDDANQNGSKKNKKDKKGCKKKLLSSSSNMTSEKATKSNLNESAEDTDKPLFDITPGQKGVKEDEREANISLNSKQKSGEPTTVKAFQRVKVEEVQFVDPRLQDNSYWAKSGAEVGYGAKAEQVLGQVRGKDFRHEKTKKKRGSYKGGMIDLQSHSIKFSYSDEE